MNKNREKYVDLLLYDFAYYGLFEDKQIESDILRGGRREYIEIYKNAYQQKPKLFNLLENTFHIFKSDNDFHPSKLMRTYLNIYFDSVWTYATNSYYEGYPLPEKMEFPNLLDLDIDLI